MSNGGADFLSLDLDAVPARSKADHLATTLRDAVLSGVLSAGTRLPATRALAADLNVSRGVVVEAYQRLADEGLTAARPRTGTVIAHAAMNPTGSPTTLDARETEPAYDLSPGLPDLSLFPSAAWLRAERLALTTGPTRDLAYGDPQGSVVLRTEVAHWLRTVRGVRAGPDDVVIVAGVAQALALLAQTLRARGVGAIGVEDPGSLGARRELNHWGMRTPPIEVDADGMVVDHIEADVVLATPAHQFPSGVVLAPHRRRDLLAWATDGRLIIEDDYDAEHRYDRAPVPCLQGAAPDQVAYAGSVSKTLAPAMRIGWLVPPADLRSDIVNARYASDLGSPTIPQLALAELLRSGAYDAHIRKLRSRHRARRNAVVDVFDRELPHYTVGGIAAGLHLVLELPDRVSDADLARSLEAAGVRVQPLSMHRQRPGTPGLVIGYAANSVDQLRDAATTIARHIRALLG